MRYLLLPLLIALFTLTGCGQSTDTQHPVMDEAGNLDAILARDELVIATRNAPTTSYIDRDGRSSGPEHDLAADFAHYLEVTPRFITYDSIGDILNAVKTHQVDMAAASITATDERRQHFLFGASYAKVTQQVVCNNEHKPRKVSQLPERAGKLVVAANTSYTETLESLAAQQPDLKLKWQAVPDVGTEALLERVANYAAGCTIADSNIVKINRRYYPSLLVMFNLTSAQPLAWPMPKTAKDLQAATAKWLKQYRKSGQLAALKNHYYGFIPKWNYVDKHALVSTIKNEYGRFDDYFTQAAKKYHFDKWLLVAQAYQESHLNPDATSPTGVKGIMMLTQPTARAMGVEDRLDPEQSIMGGAKYLRKMENKLPSKLVPPDRYYFALAAYNIGYYHLRDAMTLAERQGLNPLKWKDVKQTLPLLMQKKYYRTVPYGYARGSEPVQYVQRIRDYSDIIMHIVEDEMKK